eukprot:6019790-Pyramimonas_sp.AAC.1
MGALCRRAWSGSATRCCLPRLRLVLMRSPTRFSWIGALDQKMTSAASWAMLMAFFYLTVFYIDCNGPSQTQKLEDYIFAVVDKRVSRIQAGVVLGVAVAPPI